MGLKNLVISKVIYKRMSNIMASLEDHKESGNKNKNGKRFDCHMGKKV